MLILLINTCEGFFIVVDDIWDVKTWAVIKCALRRTNSESMIITTTRKNDVAEACSSLSSDFIYNIRPLNDKYSRKLFHRRLFNSEEDCPAHLQELSEDIIKKCDGLPLAIIAISGLLASRGSTHEDWDEVKNSIGCGLERNDSVEAMIKILSLSYFDLPPHLRTCLLYLSIYPENAIIKRGGLIRRWIAEGFIHKEGKYTVHQVGQRCFNELVNRSLIQPEGLNKFHRVESFRVHDTILEFIIYKSIEVNFVTLVGVPNMTTGTQSKVRRLSLQGGNQGNIVIPTGLVLSHVRSVSVFGDSVDIPSLDEFIHVRVVDFGHCGQLADHHLEDIGRLFQLRYLNLSWTSISELPEQIGQLQSLEMLDLRGTCVCELPASTVNLGNLVHLLIGVGVKLPDGIAKMQALEILKHVRVFMQSLGFMPELGQLKNMRRLCLDFYELEDTTELVKEESQKAIASSLHNLGTQNLRALTISSGSNFLQGPFSPTQLINLQEFYTLASTIPQVPQWLGSLVNLQKLRLELERVRQEDMCIFRCLPVLLILDLVACQGSLEVGGEVGFRCLTAFGFTVFSGEMNLKFAVGSMPNLENLTMLFCPDETDGDFHFGIENLPCLTSVKCEVRGYDGSRVDSAKAALERVTSTHPNHPTLSFEKSCI
jgi:disease resistance protein RPM1